MVKFLKTYYMKTYALIA
ncbi:MAG: hypothetical protein QG588_1631, partial [Candidatus Poribacteria bacterium]|nr:hypothetical protein [Candidatus Poribacteria bacterium]